MPCGPCQQDPTTHSFEKIGMDHHNHIFYTSYRTMKDYSNSIAISAHITEALTSISGDSWIWIIDCKFIEAKHMIQLNVIMKLLEMLRQKFGASLMGIYLINSGAVIKSAIVALGPFITKEFSEHIYKVKGTPLELHEAFTKKYGFTKSEVDSVIRRIMKDYA
jgi:CRAL/TRIO domain